MKQVNFLAEGIRRVSGEQQAGAASCDNLLNLRNEYRSLKVIGDKLVIEDATDFIGLYEHRLPNRVNIIGVRKVNGKFVVYNITDDTEVYSFTPVEDVIDIVFINNLMMVSVTEDELTGDGYRIVSFVWKDDEYSLYHNGSLPATPDFTISIEDREGGEYDYINNFEIIDVVDYVDHLKSLYNKVRCTNDKYTQGVFLVSVNYTLFDGSQTKPSPPKIVFAGTTPHESFYKYTPEGGSSLVSLQDIFVTQYDGDTSATRDLKLSISSSKVKFKFNFEDDSFYQANKDIIKSINVYSTRSLPFFDFEQISNGDYSQEIDDWFDKRAIVDSYYSIVLGTNVTYKNDGSLGSVFPIKSEYPDEFQNESFYLQKSIPLSSDYAVMNEEFDFKVDDDVLASELLNVDASGYLRYYGKMKAYNNRLHLYDLKRKLIVDESTLASAWGYNAPSDVGAATTATAIVHIKTETKTLKHKFNFNLYIDSANRIFGISPFIAYPDSRAFKVDITSGIYSATVELISSNTLNYSYHYTEGGRLPMAYGAITPGESDLIYTDKDTVVVSAQSNPTYYDNSNSYRIQGNISSISILTDGVSELEIGRFPLSIFTDNGIYILEQGTGKVLYGRSTQISEMKVLYPSIQTKMGVFFVADRGVYSLAGRIPVKISDIVEGEPDLDVRNCSNYNICCYDDDTYKVEILPNIRKFCDENIKMAYDDIENELFVSNVSQSNYSYAYNVKSKNWHSVDFAVIFARNQYAIIKQFGVNNAINLNVESFHEDKNYSQIVHIQTRALTFGSYAYKTIFRAITRCDAISNEYLDGNTKFGMLSFYIFGSNDIKNWYLVGAKQTTGYTDKLQIQKIANNYKYFIFVIGGYVNQYSFINQTELIIDEKFNNKLR